jgi:hypothetical protein
MWLWQQPVDIVGGSRIREAAVQLARCLQDAIDGRVPNGEPVWDFITDKRVPFLTAAREKLEILSDD